MTAEPELEPRRIGRYPWVAMFVILGGSYMMVIDTTVLGVALPDVARELESGGFFGIDWVVTAYLIAVGAVQPATGWLTDRFGKKQTWLWSLALFVIGSAMAGLAPSMELLVLARIAQGLGGGAMQPVGQAMIYELFPVERRGTALGVWGVAIMAAPALGPPLGGWVTTSFSWRWIFLVNIPVGIVVLVMGWRLLRELRETSDRTLDAAGWVMAAIGIVLLVVTLRQASDWGFTDPRTLVSLVTSAVLLTTIARRFLRRGEDALLDLQVFKVPVFTITVIVTTLVTFTQFGRLTYFPIELQYTRGLGADEVGLILAPSAVAVAISMPIGGWLTDRIGARVPVAVGLAMTAIPTWFLGQMTVDTSTPTIIFLLVSAGFWMGFSIMPPNVVALSALPAMKIAHGAAIKSINRQVSGAAGTAVLAAVLIASMGAVSPESLADPPSIERAQASFNLVFNISFWLLLAAAVLALFLPGRDGMKAIQRERRAEEDALAAAAADAAPAPALVNVESV